ncbi:MAG: FHA domain-containing protein [Myxococcota bacterium]|nr:FHA domain-containing protein [Myxococcota bacterium]
MSLYCWLEGLNGSRKRIGPDGLLLGRGRGCAFRTLDTRVSVRHAEVNCREDEVFLTPRGVSPTELNGSPIHNPRQLSDGDWISLAPGVLLRVIIMSPTTTQWKVRVGAREHGLTPDGPPLHLGDNTLQARADGTLQLSYREAVVLNGVTLEPDRRSWILEEGDALALSNGTRLQVTDGPAQDHQPPPVWGLCGPLRSQPPHAARLAGPNTLQLSYADTDITVPVRDAALLRALLGIQGAIEVDPDALLVLQEDLIRGGVDGFSLLSRTAAGVCLQLQEPPPGVTPQPVQSCGSAKAWWIRQSDGSRMWLDSGGVLIGRNPDCDVRYAYPYVHRYHALIRQRSQHMELIPLGQNPCYINGMPITKPTLLEAGARVTIEPSAWLELNHTVQPAASKTQCTVSVAEVEHRLQSQTLFAGGGEDDDLYVAGWPARAISLLVLAGAVFCEPHVEATRDGLAVQPHLAHRLVPGQDITINGQALTLTDHTAVSSTPARLVILHPFQKVGRLLFQFDDRSQVRVCLHHQCYQLMQLLLEAHVSSRLRRVTRTRFPGRLNDRELPQGAAHTRDLQLEVGRVRRLSLSALNTIIHQTRSELIRAGINGEHMLEEGEGWARLNLGESCNVKLYS